MTTDLNSDVATTNDIGTSSTLAMTTIASLPRSNHTALIGGSVGGVAALVVLVGVAIVIFVLRRRRALNPGDTALRLQRASGGPDIGSASAVSDRVSPSSPEYAALSPVVPSNEYDDIAAVRAGNATELMANAPIYGIGHALAVHNYDSPQSKLD